jgi:hypothetical protein
MENDLTIAVQNDFTIYVIDIPSCVTIPEFYEGVSRLLGDDQFILTYNNVDLAAYWEWWLADFDFENGAIIHAEVLSDGDDYSF